MTRRIDAGPLIALIGAVLLLISLFLVWFEPAAEAWDVFEIADLLLAGIAIAGILAAASLLGDLPVRVDARWLPWLAAAALLLVVATLLDPPPAAGDRDPDVGLWLALAGAALMSAGALLVVASVSVTFDVAARERRRRMPAVDSRPAEAGDPPAATPASPAAPVTEVTEPLVVPKPKNGPAA